ncbi:CapA family protein [Paenibacillus jiagnxiensis]|uniref:CapA family protein n=1 Tax=Paenibacillus jiagnxiensis TaxID=3228926 RepID=UPI0033A77958
MPPSRVEERNALQKRRRRSRIRAVTAINLILLFMIIAIIGYYYITEGNEHIGRQMTASSDPGKPSDDTDPGMSGDVSVPEPAAQAQQESEMETVPEAEPDISAPETVRTAPNPAKEEEGVQEETGLEEGADTSGGSPDDTGESAVQTGDEEGSAAPEAEKPEAETAPDAHTTGSDGVILNFVGDMQFSGKVEQLLQEEGYDYPYKRLGSLFKSDDLTVGNLETPVTDGGTGAANKTYVYKSSPDALPELAAAGMDVVNVANNHILDQGVSGLKDTLAYLRHYGILYMGAGKNAEEAYAPVYVERKGMTIALLGFSRVIPEVSWYAGAKSAGVAGVYDPAAALQAIRQASKKADLVIVTAHWGKERASVLEDHQTELAHAFIDAGADLVIGSHPHVLQGLEMYKGKWVAYSTGNFIFSKSLTEATWDTAVFQASCTKDGACGMKLIPCRAELGQPIPLSGEKAANILKKVENMSSPNVSIDSTGRAAAG